jgi:N-acetyl-alpha-D-glucosaminyl L-malate synthase BshA
MNIGIVCYASVGGSGVVASELARCLAERGHHTHVISSDTPFRLRESTSGVRFHRVETPGYPLFREPQYLLALANRVVQVARSHRLDIIHAHYAIPHAAAAYLARQILASGEGAGRQVPRTITTLHGTDVTILGSDPSYRETWRSVSISPTRSPPSQPACAMRPSERCASTATSSSSRTSSIATSIAARRTRSCAGSFARRTRSW